MLFDEILLELFDMILVLKGQIKMVCSEEKLNFFNFTDSRINLYVRAHYLKYVKGTHQGHGIAFSDI